MLLMVQSEQTKDFFFLEMISSTSRVFQPDRAYKTSAFLQNIEFYKDRWKAKHQKAKLISLISKTLCVGSINWPRIRLELLSIKQFGERKLKKTLRQVMQRGLIVNEEGFILLQALKVLYAHMLKYVRLIHFAYSNWTLSLSLCPSLLCVEGCAALKSPFRHTPNNSNFTGFQWRVLNIDAAVKNIRTHITHSHK